MYEVIIENSAEGFINNLDKIKKKRILDKISELENFPFLGKKLKGRLEGLRSLRIDEFREIYTIKDIELIILVLKIGNRSKIYKI